MSRTPPVEMKTREVKRAALSYANAATYVGLAEKTLRNRVADKTFPVRPRRYGRKPLFLVRELDQFLESLPSERERKRSEDSNTGAR